MLIRSTKVVLAIKQRYEHLDRSLTKLEQLRFKHIAGGDLKQANFGIINSKTICLDYGHIRKYYLTKTRKTKLIYGL